MIRPRLQLILSALLLFLVSLPIPGRAEVENNAGVWLMGLGQGSLAPLSPKLDRLHWWLDAQARFRDDVDGFHQTLLRPGLGYATTEHSVLWLGYAWIRTSPAETPNEDEHRIWQQWTWSIASDHISTLLRSRLEQRFPDTGQDVGWRFRQFVKLSHPLSFAPRASLVAYDELFFDLNATDWGADPGFAQNRLFAGFAWRLDDAGRWIGEIGYLNQFIDGGPGPDTMNHLVSLNLLFK